MTLNKFLTKIFYIFFAVSAFSFSQTNNDSEMPDSKDQRTFVAAVTKFSYDLNPHTASYNTEAQILSGLYEGLFSYDPVTMDPLYAICKSHKLSRNKKRWTFTLREDAKFSNGNSITAQSVKDSWMNLLSNKNAPFASLLDCIEGVEEFRTGNATAESVKIIVKDELTLNIYVKEPVNYLPRVLCNHAFTVKPVESDVFSGPFILESQTEDKITLVKNPNYWDSKNVNLPQIDFLLSDAYDENCFLFNTGKIDWIDSGFYADKIYNKNSTKVFAEFAVQYLFLKTNRFPWNKQEFRNALMTATPWEELRKGCFIPATTFVYPISPYPKNIGLDETDQDEAILMMKDARTKYNVSQDTQLEIIFALPSENETMKKQAELLAKAWEPLGVKLTVQTTSASRYNHNIKNMSADIFGYTWIGDFADPISFLELFRTGSSLNVSGYSSKEFDDLLVMSSQADTTEDCYKILAKAEQILLDDGVIMPIQHPISVHAIDLDCVGGWSVNALDIHPLKYLYFRKPEVKIPNLVKIN